MKTEVLPPVPDAIARACALLAGGEVVALPTETVYGLAGNAFERESVLKIFKAKERPSFDPLIVHVSDRILSSDVDPVEALAAAGILAGSLKHSPVKEAVLRAMRTFWPGPLTLVLPKGAKIPDEVTSGEPTVGIRMPAHPLFQKVLGALDFPLAAPSANRFGRISPTTADHVFAELSGRIPAILDGGPCAVGVESTIVAVSEAGLALLRPGKISREELERVFAMPVVQTKGLLEARTHSMSTGMPAPGMLDQHYAPVKPLYLYSGPAPGHTEILDFALENGAAGRAGFLLQRDLSFTGSLEEAAQKLFSEMRRLDQDPYVDFIVADLPAGTGSGLAAAIADRLDRASVNKPLKPRPSPTRRDGRGS